MGNASASYPRRGAYWLSGIVERELLIPLLVGDEMLIVEPIVAWVAPKVVVGVILLGGVGRANIPTTKEWAGLSVMILSWSVTIAGLFLYGTGFFRKIGPSSILTSKTGQKDPSSLEFSKCTVIEGSWHQANPRVSPWV